MSAEQTMGGTPQAMGGFGAWEITIYPQGGKEVVKKVVVARSLVPVIKLYPDTMEARFLGEGECCIDATDGR